MVQNVATMVFSYKVVYFNIAQKFIHYLGYVCKKICSQLSFRKIAQSGHTGGWVRMGSIEAENKTTLFQSIVAPMGAESRSVKASPLPKLLGELTP